MSDQPNSQRLNKYLALQLGISRREADNLIEQGKVTVNGAVAELGGRYITGDIVTSNGNPVEETASFQYIALNKPIGYVCSRRAQGENPTIYSLLPQNLHALKPVGRLDKDSSGLILLTNNGDFAYQMTHPKFQKTKTYLVRLDRNLEPLHQQMISDYGVQLEDGVSKFTVMRQEKPSTLRELQAPKASHNTYEITMKEGRNRQIRRTFVALGYDVVRLHRIQFGNYSLGDIQTGKYTPVRMS